MRLSIEVSPEQHRQLKALTSFQGKSIKEYVLEKLFPPAASPEDARALEALQAFLEPRMHAPEVASPRSVRQIFEAAHQQAQ